MPLKGQQEKEFKLRTKIIEMIFKELRRAEKQHPNFPKDLVFASAIGSEEAGELTKECWDYQDLLNQDLTIAEFQAKQKEILDRVLIEGIQVAAMGLRFLFNLAENHGIKLEI